MSEEGVLNREELKMVYIAPMKALAQELVGKFSKSLAPLGLTVPAPTAALVLALMPAPALTLTPAPRPTLNPGQRVHRGHAAHEARDPRDPADRHHP